MSSSRPGVAPLGPPLLPWDDDIMGRGHIYITIDIGLTEGIGQGLILFFNLNFHEKGPIITYFKGGLNLGFLHVPIRVNTDVDIFGALS